MNKDILDLEILKIVQNIGDIIDKKCIEHITTSGLRFEGISRKEILDILEEYGYEREIPF